MCVKFDYGRTQNGREMFARAVALKRAGQVKRKCQINLNEAKEVEAAGARADDYH